MAISQKVQDVLRARCIISRSSDVEGLEKIHEHAEILFGSLFGNLTSEETKEYAEIVNRKRSEKILAEAFDAIESEFGPN